MWPNPQVLHALLVKCPGARTEAACRVSIVLIGRPDRTEIVLVVVELLSGQSHRFTDGVGMRLVQKRLVKRHRKHLGRNRRHFPGRTDVIGDAAAEELIG